MTLSETIRYLSAASLLTASAIAKPTAAAKSAGPEQFSAFYNRVIATKDSAERSEIVSAFLDSVKATGRAVLEDSTVHFLFQGKAERVSVPGDLNGWDPKGDTMTRIPRTNLFHLAKDVAFAARFEYKIVADSVWMLDPLNQQQAIGGYGANSEIWMPGYTPPPEIEPRQNISHGRIDTMKVRSKLLGRIHTAFVYTPPGYSDTKHMYPSIYVMDGGEYLSLALMNNVLDNLIADERIEPVVAIFLDPRTDIRDSKTSMRMQDYTMSDSFVNFMIRELRPRVMMRFRVSNDSAKIGIMGASLGGLIATYAGFTRPERFGLVAAQSPSYWWNQDSMITLIKDGPRKNVKFYIDTGTIRDARDESRRMVDALEAKGYALHYREYPEGHNWVNWRARLDDILEYFWGTKK